MRRARTELDAQRWEALLVLTQEHARRFPSGAMLEERDAWSAVARCRRDGRVSQARVRAFSQAHPRSSLLVLVERACGKSPTETEAPSKEGL